MGLLSTSALRVIKQSKPVVQVCVKKKIVTREKAKTLFFPLTNGDNRFKCSVAAIVPFTRKVC